MHKLKNALLSPILMRIFTVGLNFISNILINRSLGLELKGQYTTIFNYANFLQLFLNFGICYAYPLLRKEKGEERAKDSIVTIIWIQTFAFLMISIGVITFFRTVKVSYTVILSSVMICNSQILFVALIDNIKERNLILLKSTMIYIVLNVFAILLFRGNLYTILTIVIVKYFYEAVILAKKNFYFRFHKEMLNPSTIGIILKIGIPTAVLAVLISCNYNIDIFMLNWMKSGDLQVGIYGVAYSLANMLWILPDAFKELIYNKTARKDDYKLVLRYIAVNMLFCIVICMGFAILGKWFLNIVYGRQYVVAYKVTLTLFIGIIPMVAFKLIHPIYVNKGRSGIVAALLIIAVGANIISSWLLIPKKGAYGAAIASVISYTICGTLFFIKFYWDFCKRD